MLSRRILNCCHRQHQHGKSTTCGGRLLPVVVNPRTTHQQQQQHTKNFCCIIRNCSNSCIVSSSVQKIQRNQPFLFSSSHYSQFRTSHHSNPTGGHREIFRSFTCTSVIAHSSRSSTTTTATTTTTTTSTTTTSTFRPGEKLRIAIVGGGCAGLSAALHLAPLVDAGYVASPIDVYDAGTTALKDNSTIPTTFHQGGTASGREIGVGIWSTALQSFEQSDRASHQSVYQEMTEKYGSWVGDVGYRVPAGHWLMRSRLPLNPAQCRQMNMPALLFLRERDMLLSLQKAVHWEETQRGTIRVHANGKNTAVLGVLESSSQPWSSQLKLWSGDLTERDYHMIVAADGTHSVLRKTYGGHDTLTRVLTGAGALPSPLDLPPTAQARVANSHSAATQWNTAQQAQSVGLQDRNYTVFRGNAPLTSAEMGDSAGISFQTWGQGSSMRFATVPMQYPIRQATGTREERQVWFITIDKDEITNEANPVTRRDLLLQAFSDWHDPVCKVVAATPPEQILMERAIAHRHCMGPVIDMNKTLERINGTRPPNSGQGPAIVFTGDAFMTVDPILAQGFTRAMEGGGALRNAVQHACQVRYEADPHYNFDPYVLRRELTLRHTGRIGRLICLLRATELVQGLGQPAGGSISGWLNCHVLRPVTRIVPNAFKAPIFDAVLKYSLGLPMWGKLPFYTQSTKQEEEEEGSINKKGVQKNP